MQDSGTDNAKTGGLSALQFVALSLRDGLDAERVYHGNAKGDMTARFLRALRTGQVDAIGFVLPRGADDLPVLIPAQCWDQCQIDWDMAELRNGGFHFVDLRILMSTLVFDRHDLFYNHQLVTELAPFTPSEDERIQLGIPARQADLRAKPAPDAASPAKPAPPKPGGRPSFKADIMAAFLATKKDLNWTEKQLAAALRAQVKADLDKADDKGLGDDAILKHVRALWRGLKNNPR